MLTENSPFFSHLPVLSGQEQSHEDSPATGMYYTLHHISQSLKLVVQSDPVWHRLLIIVFSDLSL